MSTLAKLLLGVGDAAYSIGDFVVSEGGYYFGVMSQADGDYAYFIAPVGAETDALWCNDADRFTVAGANSPLDGMGNSVKIAALGSSWAAARYCRAYTGGGKTDWFLWAREEAELAGRTLSPIANGSTSTTFGAVPDSIPPYPSFADMPSQASSSPLFIAGGAQALRTDITYWCSGPEVTSSCAAINFNTGAYSNASKGTASRRVRPIRKVRLSTRTKQDVLGSAYQSGAGTWVVPANVTTISVLCVAAGEAGSAGQVGGYDSPGAGGPGGANGVARYLNNIAVTPGESISYHVGNRAGDRETRFGSYFSSTTGGTAVAPGPTLPNSGAAGGPGSATAIGITGQGHNGISLITPNVNQGYSASYVGGWPGGGGGGGGGGAGGLVGGVHPSGPGQVGAHGAIRIMFEGDRRQYPNTNTADEFEA